MRSVDTVPGYFTHSATAVSECVVNARKIKRRVTLFTPLLLCGL